MFCAPLDIFKPKIIPVLQENVAVFQTLGENSSQSGLKYFIVLLFIY